MTAQRPIPDPLPERLPVPSDSVLLQPRRSNKRWWFLLLGVAIGVFCLCAFLLGTWIFFIQRGIDEVNKMGPWPGPEVEPDELLDVDLSDLGLKAGQIHDAQDQEIWANGDYVKGSMISYKSQGKETVYIWVLQYESVETAARDFSIVQSMAQQTCLSNSWAEFFGVGVIHCRYRDAYDKLFWNNTWIVDVVALEGTNFTSDVLVDAVRDALAAHWTTMAESSD